jgi:hypothetical protein
MSTGVWDMHASGAVGGRQRQQQQQQQHTSFIQVGGQVLLAAQEFGFKHLPCGLHAKQVASHINAVKLRALVVLAVHVQNILNHRVR